MNFAACALLPCILSPEGRGIRSIASSARAGEHLMCSPCEQDCPSRRPYAPPLGTTRQGKGAAMAGKPQTLATTSAFEILGPVMVGPSSSHTAGALRCAQVAASLLEGASLRSPLACGTPLPTPTAATAPIVRSSRASWASTPTTRTSSRPSTSHASRASTTTLTSRATTPPSTPTRSTSTWSTPREPRLRYAARAGWRQDAHQPH